MHFTIDMHVKYIECIQAIVNYMALLCVGFLQTL